MQRQTPLGTFVDEAGSSQSQTPLGTFLNEEPGSAPGTSVSGRSTASAGTSFSAIHDSLQQGRIALHTVLSAAPIMADRTGAEPYSRSGLSLWSERLYGSFARGSVPSTDIAGRTGLNSQSNALAIHNALVAGRSVSRLVQVSSPIHVTGVSGRTAAGSVQSSSPIHAADVSGRVATGVASTSARTSLSDAVARAFASVSTAAEKLAGASIIASAPARASSTYSGAGTAVTDLLAAAGIRVQTLATPIHAASATARARTTGAGSADKGAATSVSGTSAVRAQTVALGAGTGSTDIASRVGAKSQVVSASVHVSDSAGVSLVRAQQSSGKGASTVVEGRSVSRASAASAGSGQGITDLVVRAGSRSQAQADSIRINAILSSARIRAQAQADAIRLAGALGLSGVRSGCSSSKVAGVSIQSRLSVRGLSELLGAGTGSTSVAGSVAARAQASADAFRASVVGPAAHCRASSSATHFGASSGAASAHPRSFCSAGALSAQFVKRGLTLAAPGIRQIDDAELGSGLQPLVLMPDGTLVLRSANEGQPVVLDTGARFKTLGSDETLQT